MVRAGAPEEPVDRSPAGPVRQCPTSRRHPVRPTAGRGDPKPRAFGGLGCCSIRCFRPVRPAGGGSARTLASRGWLRSAASTSRRATQGRSGCTSGPRAPPTGAGSIADCGSGGMIRIGDPTPLRLADGDYFRPAPVNISRLAWSKVRFEDHATRRSNRSLEHRASPPSGLPPRPARPAFPIGDSSPSGKHIRGCPEHPRNHAALRRGGDVRRGCGRRRRRARRGVRGPTVLRRGFRGFGESCRRLGVARMDSDPWKPGSRAGFTVGVVRSGSGPAVRASSPCGIRDGAGGWPVPSSGSGR